jgi:alkanesulfonate monooxygenase SsuD/methylene tetrahydromethanopterin reductase-like flavin-dependent oxidoreductase (luciferase family)
MTDTIPQIGLSLTRTFQNGRPVEARQVVRAAAEAGLDHLQVGDHVSFFDGTGFDGLILAAAAVAMQDVLPVHVSLYLLALRHPVPVARQLAEIARLAPGRLALGVGVGGEDRHEFEVCGVDPSTRGARTDEALTILRQLLTGKPVTAHGRFFDLDSALISPAPEPSIPLLVGGRSDAALRRTARLGDGWFGLWVSPRRFGEAVETISREAEKAQREVPKWQHGLSLWCGVDGPDGRGEERLAKVMEGRYKISFQRFRRWCPVGTPADVAAFIRQYAGAGCSSVTLALHGADPMDAVEQAAEIRALLHEQS